MTMITEVISASTSETRALGKKIGRSARGGDVILLVGDLGAGKTTFTQGIAVGMGVQTTVRSPTFVMVSEHPGRMPLYHIDLYRIEDVAEASGVDVALVKARKLELDEANPMLGHRGCRRGITYPEIYEMQARAIFEAAATMVAEGKSVVPEVMVPLIVDRPEFDMLKRIIDETAHAVEKEKGDKLSYLIGTMIELPRACLKAGSIAETAEFFSFGTTDLTQTTYGFSRDDAAPFLEVYQDKGVMPVDPFMTIDVDGVGELVRLGCEKGRATRPDIKLGICGEHGGDPVSVRFCHEVGLTYVSCSPVRVPIARLSAAQAASGGDAGAAVENR